MKKTHVLITSDRIDLKSLSEFAGDLNAVYEKSGEVYQYRISKGDKHIWIYDDASMLAVYEDMNRLSELSHKLGDLEPRSFFVLELSSSNENNEFLHEFLCRVAEKINCVWEDFEERFYSRAEISRYCG
jgi:hypothetical protein